MKFFLFFVNKKRIWNLDERALKVREIFMQFVVLVRVRAWTLNNGT